MSSEVFQPPYLLAVDLGTSNVKAIITDYNGQFISEFSTPVQLFCEENNKVEQDIDEIFSAALKSMKNAVAMTDGSKIGAIGFSSQGGAMQILDSKGNPEGQVISWLDLRGAPFDAEILQQYGKSWFRKRTGRAQGGLAIGQILRLQKENPAFGCSDGHQIGFVGDIVVGRLCGCPAQDGTSASLTSLYNPFTKTYDEDILSILKMPASSFPHLLDAQAIAGGLLKECAREIGVPSGIPVSVAIHDQYAATLGTATVHSGDVLFGAGTAWVLLAVSDIPARTVTDSAFFCSHIVPDLYGQLLSLTNGGSSFAWATKLLGLNTKSQEELDSLILEIQPGSEGLSFWPLLAPYDAYGLKPGTRGQLNSLQFYHDARHVMRAVVEGLACELARYLQFLLNSGIEIDRLIMCGKAGSSLITPQILADITGLKVDCMDKTAGSTLGAAVLAKSLIEPETSIASISEQFVPPSREISPGENYEKYQQIRQNYFMTLPWKPWSL
ncbi:MAG: FGGY-family carbohydrate kinase [Planctomycetia bacterium]|nr:FGGY-family carbohydrate kinase [Planctomycetia bacterium]